MVSAYQQFVKDHIHQFKHLPAKERMKAVAQLYKKGSEAPAMKKGKGRPKKGGTIMSGAGVDEKGGSFLGDMVPFGHMLGLGLEEKKKGGSFLGDMVPFGHMMGLGLDGKGMPVTGAGMKKGRGRPKKGGALMTGAGVEGGSFLGDMIPFGHMMGLGLDGKGMKKGRGRPKKGGAMMTGAGVEGGSFLGDMVPFGHMLGLGLDGKGMKKRGRPSKKGGAMVESPTMSGDTGAGFGDWFFKGLTAPFALASKVPIPGLQQIGQAGTKAFNAIGAPTLF
jgi:hypothetical protein